MSSDTPLTSIDMAIMAAGGLAAILKPYHTTKASIEAFSLSKGLIPEKQYLSTTFSIMVEVQPAGRSPIPKPIVMSVRETRDELYEDIRRIFFLQGDKINISVPFASAGAIHSQIPKHGLDADIEPLSACLWREVEWT